MNENWCCITCEDIEVEAGITPWWRRQFPMCPECGNKRCPKATHHDNKCTKSNESGQPGSVYGGLEDISLQARLRGLKKP